MALPNCLTSVIDQAIIDSLATYSADLAIGDLNNVDTSGALCEVLMSDGSGGGQWAHLPIYSGVGAPAVNAPCLSLYVDTNSDELWWGTGNVWSQISGSGGSGFSPGGLASNCKPLVSDGAGGYYWANMPVRKGVSDPVHTLNCPQVYLNTTTGSLWYGDTTGWTVVQGASSFTAARDTEVYAFESIEAVTQVSNSGLELIHVPQALTDVAMTVGVAPSGNELFEVLHHDVNGAFLGVVGGGVLTTGSLTTGLIAIAPATIQSGEHLSARITSANGSERSTVFAYTTEFDALV